MTLTAAAPDFAFPDSTSLSNWSPGRQLRSSKGPWHFSQSRAFTSPLYTRDGATSSIPIVSDRSGTAVSPGIEIHENKEKLRSILASKCVGGEAEQIEGAVDVEFGEAAHPCHCLRGWPLVVGWLQCVGNRWFLDRREPSRRRGGGGGAGRPGRAGRRALSL